MKRSWYFACFAVILAGLLFRQPLILIVALLGLLVLITTDIWAKYCLNDLLFRRDLSEKRVLFGEEITLSVGVENAKLLPLPWLEIEDVVPKALTIRGRRLRINASSNRSVLENLFSPRWYERVTRRYTVSCNARGVHTFGPTQMRSGDLFGFSEHQETIENKQFLIVYPLVVPLSSFNLPARYPFGDRRAQRRLLEDPSRVMGVRDYAYGDDLRRVHWKATARTMQMQSKVYEATTTYTLVLFLNVSSQLDAYFGIHPELQELAICAAASVTDWALDEGYAVGLYSNSVLYMPEMGMQMSAKEEQNANNQQASLNSTLAKLLKNQSVQVPAASNEEQRKRLMEVLARIQTFFSSSIEEVMQNSRAHLPAGATVVLITSTISDPLLDSLVRLKQAGHAVTILMVGDQPVASHLAGISMYYLGGEKTWQDLKACYTTAEDTGVSELPGKTVQAVGFKF
jgi:uncharacterized protein (DUF58 family)